MTDSVPTPSSGVLTIEGECSGFACASYQYGSKSTNLGYCNCITAVTEWGNITRIPNHAFRDCSKLAISAVPDGVTSIGDYAFYNCSNITLATLPSGVTSIGSYAFYNCNKIALTSLPSGITSIGDYVFYNCSNITLATLPSGVTSIESFAFYGCTNLALTSLPSGVTSIKDNTFYRCANMNLRTLAGITNIESYALAYTPMAEADSLTLPEGVTTIGQYAFTSSDDSVLKEINIPSTVTSIGGCAFHINGAVRGRTVNILAETPPILGVNDQGAYSNFDRIEGVTIKVPTGCGAAYKADESWVASGYAARVVEGL